MEISIFDQCISVLKFLLVGIYFGFIYDVVKLFRCLFCPSFSVKFYEKHVLNKYECVFRKNHRIFDKIVMAIFDFLFFIIITPQMCIFVYGYCNGNVRWFIFFGTLVGFILYKISIGRFFGFLIQFFVFYIKVWIFKLCSPLLQKIKILFSKTKKRKKSKQKRKMLIGYGNK